MGGGLGYDLPLEPPFEMVPGHPVEDIQPGLGLRLLPGEGTAVRPGAFESMEFLAQIRIVADEMLEFDG